MHYFYRVGHPTCSLSTLRPTGHGNADRQHDVKRVLVDTGSSVNILYKSSLERMSLLSKDLEPYNQTIYGFSEEGMKPTGMIRLPITIGTIPLGKTVLASFIVVDWPSVYEVPYCQRNWESSGRSANSPGVL